MVSDAVDSAQLARVLVIKLRHHGDVLLASPVLSVLKARARQVEIDALVYDDTRDMLDQHPALAQLHTVGRRWRALGPIARAGGEFALWRTLRARRYDLIVHLTDHPRGAWLARTLGATASVAPARAGRWWNASFTHRYPVVSGGRRHIVETHLDALRRIGLQSTLDERRLVLEPGAAAVAHVDGLLASHGLGAGGFIHLHPASRWRFKCWPVASNVTLIDALVGAGYRVVLTGAPTDEERAFIADILAHTQSRLVDLTGALTLKQLAALTACARLFVGVDSAPMHMAAAMGTPVVALFGPSGDIEWGPWQVAHRVVSSQSHPCRPCGFDGCGGGKVSDCLTAIPPARVLDAVRSLLAETGR